MKRVIGRACVLGLAGMALVLAVPLLAQIRGGIQATGWKYPERYELPITAKGQTNRLKALIMGQEGRHLSNRVYLVTRMQLEHYELNGQTNLVAQAPECLFNLEDRIAWSTGRLEIVAMNGAMKVEGNEGFEVLMTNSVLTLSNRVRTVIQREFVSRLRP